MIIEAKKIGFSYSVSLKAPEVFTLKERDGLLQQLNGKRICIDFQEDIDGSQTAARLIKETLQNFGVIFKDLREGVDAYVWIQEGSQYMRFAFVVANPSDEKHYLCFECGPRELTASIMMAIYNFFYGYVKSPSEGLPSDKLQTLLQSLDTVKSELLDEIEQELLKFGDQAVDALLASADECNRRITAAGLAQQGTETEKYMMALERRIKVLGIIRSPRAVPAILDALADSAGTVAVLKKQIDELYDYPNPFYRHDMLLLATGRLYIAKSLNNTSIAALAAIGYPALSEIRKHLPSSSPPVQKSLKKALRKIEKKSWQFRK